MKRKLDLAYDLINAFMQWFIYHHMDLSDDIKQKIEKFQDCEVEQ